MSSCVGHGKIFFDVWQSALCKQIYQLACLSPKFRSVCTPRCESLLRFEFLEKAGKWQDHTMSRCFRWKLGCSWGNAVDNERERKTGDAVLGIAHEASSSLLGLHLQWSRCDSVRAGWSQRFDCGHISGLQYFLKNGSELWRQGMECSGRARWKHCHRSCSMQEIWSSFARRPPWGLNLHWEILCHWAVNSAEWLPVRRRSLLFGSACGRGI